MLASGTALVLAFAGFLVFDWINFRNSMVRVLSIRASIIGYNSVSPLLFRDEGTAAQTLAALKADAHTTEAAVYNKEGRLFATYSRGDAAGVFQGPPQLSAPSETARFEKQRLNVFRRIIFQEQPIGTVYLQSDLEELSDRLKQYTGIGLVVLSISTLVALLISAKLQRTFSEPVSRMAEAAQIVSREKDYSIRVVATANRDELDLLVETFNDMLSQIQQRDAELENARQKLEQRVVERTAELQERTSQLESLNKELEAFTYSIAHDLRAPLRRIDGFAQLLVEDHGGGLPEEAQHCLDRVREGTRQMGQLVDDLLNLARLGRQEVRLQVTGLGSLVQAVVVDLKREAEGRTIQWKLQPLPFVECDPALIRVVFANLLSNAVKYTRPRQPAVIEVGTAENDGQAVVFVRDNGVGFSMKYADKLFGVFQRLHRQEDFEGTGVGLATVQRIVHKHGGQVWAEGELDKGACFYFTLGTQPHSEPEVMAGSGRESYAAERSGNSFGGG